VERQVMRVYETVAGAGVKVHLAGSAGWSVGPTREAQGTTGGSE
jgi:phosphatidylinositol alpha-mannosyltransferase